MIFIETKHFTRIISDLLSDDEYAALQFDLRGHPDVGDIIEGSGGIRKIRFAAKGKGKRGGARVIYYWKVTRSQILLLDAFSKNEKTDLTKDEIKHLRRIVDAESRHEEGTI